MNERMIRLPVAFALGLAMLAAGCRKDPEEVRWDVDGAVPLLHTTLTVGDLIGDTLIGTDGDGNVSIIYSTRLFEVDLDTVLIAPDTSFRYRYPTDDLINLLPIPLNPGFSWTAVDELIRFDLDQLELSELRARTGQLSLAFTNRLGTSLLTDFELPGATLNGNTLNATPVVPPGSTDAPSSITQLIALDGYHFDLRGDAFDEVNTLAMTLNLRTDPSGPSVQLTMTDSIEAVISYNDIVPDYARGYFGQRDIDLDADTSSLNVFDGMSGLLDIDEATAVLNVRNGIGVDIRANIDHIRSVNRNTNVIVDLDHAITSAPLNLDRALDLGNTFQASANTYTLNTTNSNIDDFIENLPDAIAYDMDVTIDPLGNVSNGNDFLYYESALTADLDVEIPMRLSATDLMLSRRTTVDLEGTLEHHAFQYGTLHLFATNRFPFSAQLTLEIVTTDDVVLGTLAPGGSIAPASVDMNGIVIAPTASQVDFTVSKEQIDLFYPGSAAGPEGARLRIGVLFNTVDQGQHIQFRSDYTIEILASLEGNYIVNGDE